MSRRPVPQSAPRSSPRRQAPPPAPKPKVPRAPFDAVPEQLGLLALFVALLLLAFPRPGWWWLAHVALVPMAVLALRTTKRRRLIGLSYLAGFAWWLAAISWLTPITGGGYVALAAYLAVYTPLAVVVYRVLSFRCRLPSVLALPMAWVSFEFMRGIVLAGGFAWFALAHTQAPYLPEHSPLRVLLIQTADLGGEWMVSFLVAMTNGAIVDVLMGVRWKKSPRADGEHSGGQAAGGARAWVDNGEFRALWPWWASVAVYVIALVAALIYGQLRIADTPNHLSQSTWPVAVVQTNIAQSNKMSPSEATREKDWQRLQALIREASRTQPAPVLIVTPETMTPGPINEEAIARHREKALEWSTVNPSKLEEWSNVAQLRAMAKELRIPLEKLPAYQAAYHQTQAGYRTTLSAIARETRAHLLIGSPTSLYDPEYRRANSVFHVRPDGSFDGERYDKIHRVPFGEYVPWVEQWPDVKAALIKYLTPYDFDYTLMPGESLTVFAIDRPPAVQPPADGRTGLTDSGSDQSEIARDHLRVATPICFEDVVARFSRKLVYDNEGHKRVDMLINITNDGWFGAGEPMQHMQMAAFRAVENRVPMARSVNGGLSGFIDSAGRVRAVLNAKGQSVGVDGVAAYAVASDDRVTLFGRVGQWPVLMLCGVTGMGVIFGAACGRRGEAAEGSDKRGAKP